MKAFPLKNYKAGFEGPANISQGNWRDITASVTLGFYDAGDILTNRGAAGAVIFTLPAPKNGLNFTFAKLTAQNFTIKAPTGSKVNGSASGGTYANTAAETLKYVYVECDGTDWHVLSTSGTWVTT